jgi:hypothetical protein
MVFKPNVIFLLVLITAVKLKRIKYEYVSATALHTGREPSQVLNVESTVAGPKLCVPPTSLACG